MPALVTTLANLLAQADHLFELGRYAAAVRAFEGLVAQAQDRGDHPTEVIARSMLARTALARRDLDAARDHLHRAAQRLDPAHLGSHARYRGSLARLAIAEGPPDVARAEQRAYLDWSSAHGAWRAVVDSCEMLCDAEHEPEDKLQWLQFAVDTANERDLDDLLGRLHTRVAATLDELGRAEEALESYQRALGCQERHGRPRDIAAAGWAVGSVACRLEDWPLARTALDRAIESATAIDDGGDLLALSLLELARVNEAAGDVIEARRLVIRALKHAREEGLSGFSPQHWDAMVQYGRALELDV